MSPCIERFPIVIWGGGALLGWIAGGLLPEDPIVAQLLLASHRAKSSISPAASRGAIIVVLAGLYLVRSKSRRLEQQRSLAESASL